MKVTNSEFMAQISNKYWRKPFSILLLVSELSIWSAKAPNEHHAIENASSLCVIFKEKFDITVI